MRHTSPTWNALVALSGLALATAAQAGQGLSAPQAETVWPNWQARISLQSSFGSDLRLLGSPQALQGPGLGTESTRGIQGGALFGDYYFARPVFGSFRASGGLMVGANGGVPVASAFGNAALPRLGLLLSSGAAPTSPASAPAPETADTVPYLGLGYSGSWWRDRVTLNADLGWVSERPTAAAGVSRALFGNQGMNQALRDMRLSPLFQLGVQYHF